MSLDFGKLEFSVSFNPTSAFPLDARSYFESLSAALAAAASAKEAGSTESFYYYGQTVVVVEENVATFYIIQPDNTLSLVKGAVFVDENIFEYDDSGNLILKGFNEASSNTVMTKGENGITWITPDNYTKKETDEKIAAAVAGANHLKRKIVGSVAEIEVYMAANDDADLYIFMVPTESEYTSNRYDEYLVISVTDTEGDEVKYVEKVGSWAVDLTNYTTKDYVDTALENKVDKDANARLITLTEVKKLEGIEEGAQANLINSISTDFSIDESDNKKLSLNVLPISKIEGLSDLLNSKASLTDVETWISENAATAKGLSENNLSNDLYNKLSSALTLKAINESEFKIVDDTLHILEVDRSKVKGLEDALNSKAEKTTVDTLITTVTSISDSLNNYVLKSTYDKDIAEIRDILTWKDLI